MFVWVRKDICDQNSFCAATTDNIQENASPKDVNYVKVNNTKSPLGDTSGSGVTEEEIRKGFKESQSSSNTQSSETVKLKFGCTILTSTNKEKSNTIEEQMDDFISKIRASRIQIADKRNVKINTHNQKEQSILDKRIIQGSQLDLKAPKRKIEEDVSEGHLSKRKAKEETSARFSNNMKDAVKTVCQICKLEVEFNHMRIHTRKAHKQGISEYKRAYGNLEENLVEAVYHQCALCSQVFLLNGDAIATHAKKHKITHKEYNRRFIILKKESPEVKLEEDFEKKHEKLMNDLDCNLKKVKPEKASSPELRRRLEQMSSEDLLKELDLLIASC